MSDIQTRKLGKKKWEAREKVWIRHYSNLMKSEWVEAEQTFSASSERKAVKGFKKMRAASARNHDLDLAYENTPWSDYNGTP